MRPAAPSQLVHPPRKRPSGPTCSSNHPYPYVVPMRSALRHVNNASTNGWTWRKGSSFHFLVLLTSIPTPASMDFTCAGLRRSMPARERAKESTTSSRRARFCAASVSLSGRGPTDSVMMFTAWFTSRGSPSSSSSRHNNSAADSDRAVPSAPLIPGSEVISARCNAQACNWMLAHVADRSGVALHPPSFHSGRRCPSGRIGFSGSAPSSPAASSNPI